MKIWCIVMYNEILFSSNKTKIIDFLRQIDDIGKYKLSWVGTQAQNDKSSIYFACISI